MCLYIRNKQPRIAKRDIVVLKYLRQDGNKYKSPCQGIYVRLGKVLVARPSIPDIRHECLDLYNRKIFSIEGGVIHAMLNESDDFGNYCAKAIIPKGTEYWINDLFGTEIAAKQMLITDEEGSNKLIDVQFFEEILEGAPEKYGIRVGDYQMIDDSFVHPTTSISKTKVRGIVCGFYEDGSPIICALRMFRKTWDNEWNSTIGEPVSWENAMKVFNGREITAQYNKQIKDNDRVRFDAFESCINYRKHKNEDWYFGSLGEVMTMLDNAAYLNTARKITGIGFIINSYARYWSCSEDNYNHSWGCVPTSCGVCYNSKDKLYTGCVVPFYAFT